MSIFSKCQENYDKYIGFFLPKLKQQNIKSKFRELLAKSLFKQGVGLTSEINHADIATQVQAKSYFYTRGEASRRLDSTILGLLFLLGP